MIIERCSRASVELEQAWARLLPQLNPYAAPPDAARLAEILRGGATELFCARLAEGGEIVGGLALVVFSTPTGTHAWIEDVIVDAGQRRQGVGEALVRAALARARERGAKALDLTSRPERAAANQLYLRLGFEARGSNLYRFRLEKPAPGAG